MQFHRSLRTAVVLLCLGTLAACSSGDGGAAVVAADGAGKRFLSIGTAPVGGAFFVVGGAIGEVLTEHRGDHTWSVSADATAGSKQNIRMLDRGELDLALANAAISYFAVRGESGWEQPQKIRSVMTLAPNVALFITHNDSGIRSIDDLRGKRVTVGPAGAGFEHFLEPLLAAHGMSYDDFSPLNANQSGAVDLLSDGAAAAAFLGGAVPTASITQASTSGNIFFVPFEESARQTLIRDYPFFRPATIPAGTYRGQDRPYEGLDVGSMHLVTGADADDQLIYDLTRTLYENRDSVVAKHPAGKAINPRNAVRDTGTEFHPGAIRFYREIGIWPESD